MLFPPPTGRDRVGIDTGGFIAPGMRNRILAHVLILYRLLHVYSGDVSGAEDIVCLRLLSQTGRGVSASMA